MDHVEALRAAGVSALKIEGRQRGKAYVAEVVSRLRAALGATAAERPTHLGQLRRLSEGQRTTSGAYEKTWR
jgi:putative protease